MVAAFKPRFVVGSVLDLEVDRFLKSATNRIFSTAMLFQAIDVICVTE